MNNFYKGGRELAYFKGLSHYAVQQKTTAIRQPFQTALQAARLANAIMFIDPITLLRKLWKSKAILLLGIALLHMFILSAQTPRKDSGADGLNNLQALAVGQKVPEEFWKKEYLIYNNGDTTRQTMEAFRGKLLVLDFWATWCAICLGQMKEKEELFSRFSNRANLVFVNPDQTKDTYKTILRMNDKLAASSSTGNFQSIIEDDYLQQLFPNRIYPRYVWIGPRGDLIALTIALSVTEGHMTDMLNLMDPRDDK
ncbi:TlpA family protein disulfide reductase [Sphingobacterium anhuiense]|uniref:TlpA family protein disulfide reductase n=1 Tax=Sphingobacterium anhuiense TaxID=493780 RepID=A0ABW5YVK1_9SPHI